MKRTDIMAAIFTERYRQNILHPGNTLEDMLPVLIEEIGEVGRALQNEDRVNLEEELVHVAAVCVRWLELL
jgi:NTP pyrophosphatase (non-canonical NTP hydrolase)